MVGIVIVF